MLFSQAQLGLISPWQWSSTTPVLSLVLTTLIYFLSNRYRNRLHHIPGPFLASLSDLYRVVHVWRGSFHKHQIALHERYGPFVRLGPNVVSIGNPDAIKLIYGNTSKAGVLNKSEFYPVQQQIAAGSRLETLFTTTNEAFHRKLRKAVSNAYAMSSLLAFEPGVDGTVAVLLDELDRRYVGEKTDGDVCDLGTWLHYFSFDVLGAVTFSKPIGFLQGAKDVEGIMGNLEKDLAYFAVAGQMPWWDRWIVKNPLKLWLSKKGWGNTTTPVTRFARARVEERSNNGGNITNTVDGDASIDTSHPSRDILSRFQEAGTKDPEFMTPQRVLAVTVANIFAGSDTTAITLRAIFYNLLRHPSTLQKLRKELEDPENEVFNDQGLALWNKVRELPYLSAVIKEGLRCHPATGLSLERIVPSTGLDICGEFFPAGTIVGCNGWVIHRSERVFGAQPELFRPERWIEATEAQRNEMNNCLFSFGAGNRSCIGKNISFLEMYKVVPALLHRFEINLEDPQKEWQVHNIFFVEQTGLLVKLKDRK